MDSIINFFSRENLVNLLDTVNHNGIWVFIGAFTLFVIGRFTSLFDTKKIKEMADKLSIIDDGFSKMINNADSYKVFYKMNIDMYKQNENFLKLLDEKAKEMAEKNEDATTKINEVIDLKVELSDTIKKLEETRQNYENLNGINEIIEPINNIHSNISKISNNVDNMSGTTKDATKDIIEYINKASQLQSNMLKQLNKGLNIKKNNIKQLNQVRDEILNAEESSKTKSLKILIDLVEKINIEKNKINHKV
jgi:hypothetical protein